MKWQYAVALSLWRFVAADGQFKSRPDLSPPRLNITIPATGEVDTGYIFMCPYSGYKKGQGFDGPEQPACYIFRDNGDLVWSSLGYLSGWVANMQVREWNGRPVITAFQGQLDEFHGHGFGRPVVLDQNYNIVAGVTGGNHKVISIHEFNVLESGSALVEIYQPVQLDLAPYRGLRGANWIVDAIIQEIDLMSGKVLFEWSSLDHVPPEDSAISLSSGHAGDGLNSSDAWDYFHINSVDKDRTGNYLISARHASTVYKINGTTGDIMWRLGGRKSDFSISAEAEFGFQHDARFVPTTADNQDCEHISVFDNSARAKGHQGGGIEIIHDKSRAKVFRLDKRTGTASLETQLASPDGLSAASQGNVQTLPGGNRFVGWGQGGAMTEYNTDGRPIFHAYLDSGEIGYGVQSYRVFRFPWKGYPREEPAIVAVNEGAALSIYVSWNGDTEAVKWKFYLADQSQPHARQWHRALLLGESKREGFETKLVVDGKDMPSGNIAVYAEAIDGRGGVLVTTQSVVVRAQFKQDTDQKVMVVDEL